LQFLLGLIGVIGNYDGLSLGKDAANALKGLATHEADVIQGLLAKKVQVISIVKDELISIAYDTSHVSGQYGLDPHDPPIA
jgi:hypothetical protein